MDGPQLQYIGTKLDRIIELLEAREARELQKIKQEAAMLHREAEARGRNR